MQRRFPILVGATVLVLAAVLLLVPRGGPEHRRGRLAASSIAIDTTSRTAVEEAFRTRWLPVMRAIPSWTGSVAGCRKGTISASYLQRTWQALNFVRALDRLDPAAVVADRYSTASTYSTQATALLMRANGALSHEPPPTWRCWTRPGARGAALSNLSLTSGSLWTAGNALAAYLGDGGANTAVGHRRWLLDPWTRTAYVGATSTSNALFCALASSSTTRANPAFTSWPSAGWFPVQLDPGGRWSWSSRDPHADLSHAHVTVSKEGRVLAVHQYAPQSGYGQPTLVWQMPRESRRTGSYAVTVWGVRTASGARRAPTTYRVIGFLAATS